MDLTLDEIEDILERYGFITHISPSDNMLSIGGHTMPIDTSFTVEMKFFSKNTFFRFFEIHNQQIIEERIRNNSPALKQAWEEYQLLLKLSK